MTSETIAEIVAEMRELAADIEAGNAVVGQTVWRNYADRIEAVAKRAYNNIDSAVCGIEDVSHYDIDGVRMAMDKTIGDYYE